LKLARCVKRDPSLVVKLTYYCVTDAALKLGRSACCSEVVGVFYLYTRSLFTPVLSLF